MKAGWDILAIGLLLLIDQAVKFIITNLGLTFTLGVFSTGSWHNEAAAFSINMPYGLIIAISIGSLFCLVGGWVYFSFFNEIDSKLLRIGIMLLIAGGLANLADRVYRGAVLDTFAFIDWNFYFNPADIYIILGGGLLLGVIGGVNRNKEGKVVKS